MRTLTKEEQQLLTPTDAINLLKEGNKRFVNNLKINRNLLQQVNETSDGQHPFAVILSCIDSRTSAELIFDQGLGDIFSIRIAGNILNDDILGSMEFACKLAGAKLIAVLGHTKCGAIQGACKQVKLGYLSGLLEKIEPAIHLVKQNNPHQNETDVDFINTVTQINVNLVINNILQKSPVINELVKQKQIGIIGGIYHADNGQVEFNEEGNNLLVL
jgi:carbonic anhydrase